MVKKKSNSDWQLYKRLLGQARPYWLHIAGLFLFSLPSTPLALLSPVPLKIAVDCVSGSDPFPQILDRLIPASVSGSATNTLIFSAVLVLAIALLSHLQSFATTLLRTYTGEKLVLGFRSRLFRHVQRLSLAYHDSKGTADSTYRIQYDTSAVQYVAIDGVIPFITSLVTLVLMLYVTWQIDWQLALVALIVSPFLFMSARIYRRQLRSQSRAVKKLESSALSVVQEGGGADDYREYIWRSRGEFSVAKDIYVRMRTGWFSERSACYLASGRPVVVQDTGFSDILPTGVGLHAVSTPEEAAEAMSVIESDYAHHAEAAREIAAQHFDATNVLTRLIDVVAGK